MTKQPNRLIAFLYGLIPLVVAVCVLFVLAVVGGKAVQGYEMRQEAKAMERRIDQLKRENRQLGQQLDYYRSDEYVEKVAREELGLVRPNDVAVIVVPSDGPRTSPMPAIPTPTPAAVPPKEEVPTWQRWLSLFVGEE